MGNANDVRVAARSAKEASRNLAISSAEQRNEALLAMARHLRDDSAQILEANAADVAKAREDGVKESLVDRLLLDEARIEDMASALEDLSSLQDPLGRVQDKRTLYNGIELERISVPLGLVAMVYEARPNVTADAAGICIKSGNACILRGGSMAERSNEAITESIRAALAEAGLEQDCVVSLIGGGRQMADELMQLHGIVDVLIPRGGAGLIAHCVECSKVPVIETGTGNCHVYVHKSADLGSALDIAVNAKCRRFGVCNAAETLLVDESVAESFLPLFLDAMAREGVQVHGDDATMEFASEIAGLDAVPATECDWETEYLGPEIAVRIVGGIDEAIAHVNRYSTKHSDAIVAQDEDAQRRFEREVDSACVYVNASTAFTDGAQFGLGAEIGISTQKLHARGPFALDALTSYKYVLKGTGQTRA